MMKSLSQRRMLVECHHPKLSIRAQCQLLGINRSSLYYQPVEVDTKELALLHALDCIYTKYPFFGARRLAVMLSRELERPISRKLVQNRMRKLHIRGIRPRRNTSKPNEKHPIYPYLLRNVKAKRVGHVYCSDITYIPMERGFMYLVAVIDVFSRYIVSWELSNTLQIEFCLQALEGALERGVPEIVNTDQGGQFTSPQWTAKVKEVGAKVSMDGRGRALDNVWIERFWRSLKYEDIYLRQYYNGHDLYRGIKSYIDFYNYLRPHMSLDYKTPSEVFLEPL